MKLFNKIFASVPADVAQQASTIIAEQGYKTAPNRAEAKRGLTVEEVHNTFETESLRLLEEAHAILGITKPVVDETANIANRLKSLGFGKVETVSKFELAKKAEEAASIEAKIIRYYHDTYPQYKFITRKAVIELCKKYGLLHGAAADFKSEIPEANLKQIENFKVSPEDLHWSEAYGGEFYNARFPSERYSESYYRETFPDKRQINNLTIEYGKAFYRSVEHNMYADTLFSICALPKDFDLKDKKVTKDLKLIKEDPIVLFPVRGAGYLIVTAWGKEASDPAVLNPKNN